MDVETDDGLPLDGRLKIKEIFLKNLFNFEINHSYLLPIMVYFEAVT